MRVEVDGDWNKMGEELTVVRTQLLCILQNWAEL